LITKQPRWRGMAALRGIVSLEVEFDLKLAGAVHVEQRDA